MSTTLVHIGDFHAAPGPRNTDRYRALDQIIGEALALPRLGAFLWPGDLFDAASNADDRNALDERLQRMADAAPVVICYGNHDRAGDLDGFARLKATYPIAVVDRPRVEVVQLATGELAAIFVLPYPTKAGLVSAGLAPGDVVDAAADVLEPVFMVAAQQLGLARDAHMPTLMIGHVNVAGSMTSTGQPNIGHEIELHPSHLDRLGDIYKGLNHIHKPQQIAGAHYAGSVCRMDYGEIEAKRWLEIRLPGDGFWPEVISHPIDVAPMYHVDGELTRDAFTWHVAGDQPMPSDGAAIDWTGADVRVRYRYRASEKSALRPERIAEEFAGALRLKIEGVAIADRELRAPEVAAARTLPEKIAAFRKVPQLEPSIATKLQLLEHKDRDALLADVAAAIAGVEMPASDQVAA